MRTWRLALGIVVAVLLLASLAFRAPKDSLQMRFLQGHRPLRSDSTVADTSLGGPVRRYMVERFEYRLPGSVKEIAAQASMDLRKEDGWKDNSVPIRASARAPFRVEHAFYKFPRAPDDVLITSILVIDPKRPGKFMVDPTQVRVRVSLFRDMGLFERLGDWLNRTGIFRRP